MLNNIKEFFYRLSNAPAAIKPGVYFNQPGLDPTFPYRLHLRVEENGNGILILNAATVIHLNHTACEYAYHLIQNTSFEEVSRDIARRYQIHPMQIKQDFSAFKEKLMALLASPDLDPVTVLGIDRDEVGSAHLSAPLRLDCALTYRTPEEQYAASVPLERVRGELLQNEWQQILEKAWNAGIPHVVFTGGEPTLRPDLPDLIAYAEKLGLVTGLLTNGLRFSEPEYRRQIMQAGLDHIMVVYDPNSEQAAEALRDLLNDDIFVTVHLTITEENAAQINSILQHLSAMGVQSVSLSIAAAELKPSLAQARDTAAFAGMALQWDLPVPYSRMNPVRLELEEVNPVPDGAGSTWLYVEPDGDVLPAQGIQELLGNLATDPWDKIWAAADKLINA